MPRTATEALALNRHQAFALADRVGGAEVQRLLSQAAFDLRQRLEAKAPTANTPTTAREMRATLDQVQQVSRELAARIGRATLNSAVAGAQEGAQGLVDYLQGAHRQFGGAGRSLGIREASLFSRSVAGARASVLRSLATTPAEQEDKAENPDGMLPELEPGEVADPWTRRGLLSRYTLGTIGEFESVLQRGIVTGKPWAEVREEITGASPFLQGAPRSWAERIVRTETMAALNRSSWEGIRAADDELGDMVKILCATIDGRTGWDSLQVHGQIRRPDEAFEWNGGFYQNPPNRPNDREVVVPHRISWPIPDELHPRSDAEVVAAWQRDRRKGSPPARAERSTVPLDLFGKSPKRKEERERDQGGAAPGAAPAAPVDAGAA